jgi:p21-activated kinase 1
VEQEDSGTDEEETVRLKAVQDRSKRLTALPPRLSLHEANDLDSWSASLFSAIPSATGSGVLTHTSSTSSRHPSFSFETPLASVSTSTSKSSPPSTSSSRQLSIRRGAPQKPIPATPLDKVNEEELSVPPQSGGPNTPLWNEILGMMHQPSSASTDTPPFTPALNELNSPTLPGSPMPNGHTQPEEEEDEDEDDSDEDEKDEEGGIADVYLGLGRRDSNRDSSISSVTVTGATIVRNASIATRARANVIDRSAPRERGVTSGSVEEEEREDEQEQEQEEQEEEEEEEEELIFPPTPSPLQASFSIGDAAPRNPSRHYKTTSLVSGPHLTQPLTPPPPASGSPHSSFFSESSSSASESDSRSSSSHLNPRRVLSEDSGPPPLPSKHPELAYLRGSPTPSPMPSPSRSSFGDLIRSPRDTFGGSVNGYLQGPLNADSLIVDEHDALRKPSIIINGIGMQDKEDAMMNTESPTEMSQPYTPVIPPTPPPAAWRYRGWLSEVVAPLEEFIDEATDPRELYYDLQEIAEAESGSIYAARVTTPRALGLSPDIAFVAIKNIPISPSGTLKLADLRKELSLTRGVLHENILTMDALYVDLVEDSLWIRMELMERSLADVVGLVANGLMVQERMIARFASDVGFSCE